MSKNDERILSLTSAIAKKKEELAKQSTRFNPCTNCSLDFRGQHYNVNTLNEEQCEYMAVELMALQMASESLNVVLKLSGYSVADWIIDLSARRDILRLKSEERKLKAMEEQLNLLLSEDKKKELAIEEIAQSLGI